MTQDREERRDEPFSGRPERPLRPTLPVLLAVALGLLTTTAAFLGTRYLEDERLRADFRREAEERIRAIEDTMLASLDVLYALEFFIDTLGGVVAGQRAVRGQ